jgi:hypothetical protein
MLSFGSDPQLLEFLEKRLRKPMYTFETELDTSVGNYTFIVADMHRFFKE